MANACIQIRRVERQVVLFRPNPVVGEERLQNGQIEGHASVHDAVSHSLERDDGEQLACSYVVPVQQRRQRRMVAMLGITKHSAQ